MTAVTEILEHCKKLISDGHQIDTQGLVHWIEDKLLEMEKQEKHDAYMRGWKDGFSKNKKTRKNDSKTTI